MRRLKYNDASQSIRFEFPDNWLTASAVNITIVDRGGDDLLAATGATVYTATTTNGAVSDGDSSFEVDGADAMAAGDRFRLSKAGDTTEIVEVLSYATKVATIAHTFDYDHSDESAVSAMWCTYALDTSTVADFPVGLQCSIVWTPNTDDVPFVEDAIVYQYTGAEISGWQEHFRSRYPNLYREATGRLESLYADAMAELTWHIRAENRELDDLREPEFLRLPIAAIMAGYIARNEGSGGEFEIKQAAADLTKYLDILKRPSLWFDKDQDLAEDEGEVLDLTWRPSGPGRFGNW